MLTFKARRRRDPTASPFLTPSQRRVMNQLSDAMNAVRDQVIADEGKLLDAIMHRPLDQVVDMITIDPWIDIQESIAAELEGDLIAGGHRYAQQVPAMRKATVNFRFDEPSANASRWARTQSGTLITNVTTSQRNTVRTFVSGSLNAGDPSRTVARNLRNVVGLTPQQAGWVQNFEDRLVSRYVGEGMTLQAAQARAAGPTARYHKRIHRYRTETIARTEILTASHEGRRQAWDQGLRQGFISPNARQEWSAEVDDRACAICEELDRTTVRIGEQFPDGDPPVHPMCRCDVLLIDEPVDPLDVSRDFRPGMGDSITVDDDEFAEMLAYSGRSHIVGRTPDGVPVFTPGRQAIHDEILERFLEGKPRSDDPIMRMTGGGPASGKGGVVKDLSERAKGRAAEIDPDAVKAAIPEYKPMVDAGDEFAAAFTHEESSYLAKRILQAAAERRIDIIYDGTGNGSPSSLIAKIETARSNGYRVTGHYVTIDTEEAIRRATARAERTGRKVPETTIRETHRKVSAIWDTASDAFDDVELFDNNVEMRLIATATRGGNVRVIDREAYDSFVRKGEG